MHDQDRDADDADFVATDVQDVRSQAEVLREVLRIYPEAMTLDELTRFLTVASADFSEHDRIQRAVCDLTAGGLIRRNGDLVLPTRAAVNFNSLAGGWAPGEAPGSAAASCAFSSPSRSRTWCAARSTYGGGER